jgi:hypothetical protein
MAQNHVAILAKGANVEYPNCPKCDAEMVDENEGYCRLRFGEPHYVCPICSKKGDKKMNLKITALLMWKVDYMIDFDGYFKQVKFTVDDEAVQRISCRYSNGVELVEEMELIDLYFSTGGLPAGIKPCDVMGIPDIVQVIAFEYVQEGDEDE